MEIPQVYALVIAGIFGALIFIKIWPYLTQLLRLLSIWSSQYFVYPKIIDRHQYFGPWSVANVLLLLIYVAINAFCVAFRYKDIKSVGLRAASLSLINMIPALAGHHLNFLADILGISLNSCQRFHRASGMMSFFLLLCHVFAVIIKKDSFPLNVKENMWALIGAISLCFLTPFPFRILRKWSYEIFLRVHQLLAGLVACSVFMHLSASEWNVSVPKLYIYIFTLTCLSTFAIQAVITIYRNWPMASKFSRAHVSHAYGVLNVRLQLSRPLKIEAGQYICLWLPISSPGFWNFWGIFQSHPFVIISWSEREQSSLELLIEPRGGMTRKLLNCSEDHKGGLNCLALFTGPHGISVPVEEYETVVLVASGFGIAAQLPYLKRLIHGYNACKSLTRRIHMVWQLKTKDMAKALQSLLNNALNDDTLDEGYILTISVYIEQMSEKNDQFYLSDRATVYKGSADLKTIVKEEREGKYIKMVQEEIEEPGEMLVMGDNKLRDDLRDVVREYLQRKVRMIELEYQPTYVRRVQRSKGKSYKNSVLVSELPISKEKQ